MFEMCEYSVRVFRDCASHWHCLSIVSGRKCKCRASGDLWRRFWSLLCSPRSSRWPANDRQSLAKPSLLSILSEYAYLSYFCHDRAFPCPTTWTGCSSANCLVTTSWIDFDGDMRGEGVLSFIHFVFCKTVTKLQSNGCLHKGGSLDEQLNGTPVLSAHHQKMIWPASFYQRWIAVPPKPA